MIKGYHKLVRDKVASIIKSNNDNCVVKKLTDEEFKYYLKLKLKEEVNELIYSKEKQELTNEISDISDILDYIIKVYKINPKDITLSRKNKKKSKGLFDKKTFLVLTENSKF